jgi:type III restriction enzyme
MMGSPEVVQAAKGDFQIHFSHDESYGPDFVVETKTEKFLCEPKRASEMTDDVVSRQGGCAATWCSYATTHAKDMAASRGDTY